MPVVLYGADNRPFKRVDTLIPVEDDPMTEVCRSFSYKLAAEQYGGAKFESRDFFCSEKTSCRESEKYDASLAVFAFCKQQVLRDVRDYIAEIQERKRKQAGRAA